MKVAVLDTSIQAGVYTMRAPVQSVSFADPAVPAGKLLHGTVIAGILSKYAPEIELVSVQMLDNHTEKADVQTLCKALRWCLAQKIPLLNISTGTQCLFDYEPVRKWVAQLVDNGQIIVAAAANTNRGFSIPASLSWVLGVEERPDIMSCAPKIPTLENIDFSAPGIHELQRADGNIDFVAGGNSMAAPYVTAQVYKLMVEANSRLTLPQITSRLGKNEGGMALAIAPDFINKPIVYAAHQKESFPCFGFEAEALLSCEAPLQQSKQAVIVPSTHKEKEMQEVLASASALPSLVYAGRLPKTLKQDLLRRGCIVWDENSAETLYEMRRGDRRKGSLPIIISIEGDSLPHIVSFAKETASYLVASSYQTGLTACFEQAYLYGFTWAPRAYLPQLFSHYADIGATCVVHTGGYPMADFIIDSQKQKLSSIPMLVTELEALFHRP